MKYSSIEKGIFISRPNRFIAQVEINGKIETCHVKNTGRCKELLVPNTDVYLEYNNNPKRKTKYSLVAVLKNNRIINMDSQAPNKVFLEYLKSGKFIKDLDYIKPECTYGNSRFDFYCEKENDKYFIEVKGVTLEDNNVVMFPDAPTERGTKHIYELIKAHEEGYISSIVFVIQLNKVKYFTPNKKRDPAFYNALKEAVKKGVNVYAFDCNVTNDTLNINNKVEIEL